jgi:hypothetical protein
MKRLDVVDAQIGHVAVIAQVRGWHRVWTPAEHELDRAETTKGPISGVRITGLATEHVAVPAADRAKSCTARTGFELRISTSESLSRFIAEAATVTCSRRSGAVRDPLRRYRTR